MVDSTDAVVYSKDDCPWCEKVIALLLNNGLTVKELKLDIDYTKEQLGQIVGTNKKLTVPQVFIDNQHVGGYDHINSYFSIANSISERN